MKYIDNESEIEMLESALEHLESAILEVYDTPYHSYLSNAWEQDAADIKARLDELYEIQNKQWEAETQEQENQYWSDAI